MEHPNLVEPGMRYYIKQTLKNCNNVKNYYNNVLFNITILLVLILLVSGILYYKYKGVINIEEKARREENKKIYFRKNTKNANAKKKMTLWI